jgi:hypothetical protein
MAVSMYSPEWFRTSMPEYGVAGAVQVAKPQWLIDRENGLPEKSVPRKTNTGIETGYLNRERVRRFLKGA